VNSRDDRKTPRYLALQALSGSFGAAAIDVIDLGDGGAQIQHAQPLRVGSRGRFTFTAGSITLTHPAVVAWSRLTPGAHGKPVYRSGLRIDAESGALAPIIERLLDSGIVVEDDAADRTKRLETDRPADVVDTTLLIARAREQLRAEAAM
jgi:hypothetical protein